MVRRQIVLTFKLSSSEQDTEVASLMGDTIYTGELISALRTLVGRVTGVEGTSLCNDSSEIIGWFDLIEIK